MQDLRVMRFFATGNDGPPLMTSPSKKAATWIAYRGILAPF